jgi:hypothetical protein
VEYKNVELIDNLYHIVNMSRSLKMRSLNLEK